MNIVCDKCGIPLSLPAEYCQQCGHPIPASSVTDWPSLDSSNGDPGKSGTLTMRPPDDGGRNDDEGLKVETLLGQIAAQSHFEERYELRGTLATGGMGQVVRHMTASYAGRSRSK